MISAEKLQRGRAKEQEPRLFANTIVALDVDGVLIEPRAYRQAVNETIVYFARQLDVDLKEFTLDDKSGVFGRSMSHFEANGIHDPWDVSAIIVSLMRLKKTGIDISLGEALNIYQTHPDRRGHPPDVILEQLKARFANDIPETMEKIAKDLTKTRDPFANNITSVFQEYVLGKELFELTYEVKSQTGSLTSLIQTQDRLLVDLKGRDVIRRIEKEGGRIVIYTGRPGLPPADIVRNSGDGYSPEAELAISKSRVQALGLVTMGSMGWLARENDTSVESLTKPNPTQALATILSALRGKTDSKVLRDAYEWGKNEEVPLEIQQARKKMGGKKLKIIVVEDSLSGVVAFINAKKILRELGLNATVTVIGVHGGNQEKFTRFKELASKERIDVITCTDVNGGIDEYFLSTSLVGKKGGLGN